MAEGQQVDGAASAGTYQIHSAGYRAEVVATGAGLRMLERSVGGNTEGGNTVALTESWPAGTKPPLSAGLILAPWPNRIGDGFFYFDGVPHQLELTEPARNNAIHGLVRRRDWRLEEHSTSRVKQSIDVGLHKGWPYPMRLSVTHEVGADGLTVTHTATNSGGVPAPYGLGVHSFVRVGDVPLDDCTLQLAAGVRLPLDPERMLPAGPPIPIRDSEYDFTAPRSLKGVWLDTPFGSIMPDGDGHAHYTLRAPDGSATVLWTDRSFRWVQVFTADPAHDQGYPDRGRAIAIEPMTCPPNSFNTGIDQSARAWGNVERTLGNGGDVKVVVCGEALVDFVPAGGNELYVPKLGGGPFNVAVTLGRLGSRVAFLGRVSTDPFGDRLAQRLTESGVDLSLLQRGSEPTTLALASLDATGAAQYTFYAGGTADRLVHDPGALPESVSALSFGTLSLLYEPGATVYEQLLRRAHEAGKLTMLDPNIRPDAIVDPAAYRTRFTRWLPFVDILKVSDDDALWLADGAADGPERWLAAGVGAVLLTRGADGLSVLTRSFRVDVAAVQVAVSDTIGAGDTVHGALLNWLDRQGSLHREDVANYSAEQWSQALSYASRAAGITISRPGADPPWAREIEGD